MTVKFTPGHPINHSLIQYENTEGAYTRTTPLLSALFSGTYCKLTLTSNSSTAPLHKRVLTAYLAASKTSDEQSAATCEKTTEEANLSVHFPSLALMDRLTIRQS
jgi:hypothetical protein